MANENWMWLASGLGWGAVNSGELLAAYPGGADEVAEALGSAKLDDILTQKQAERLASTRPEDFRLPIAHAETLGVAAIGYDDERYPAMLRTIHNPPPVLFVKGDAALLNGQLSISIVGSRRPSAYGVEVVKAIGRGVALGGAIIVSGLAAGLDAEAHKAALAVNGPTIACIAFGHDKCYPAANKKLMEVIERHGAVVSEYPPGTGPEKPYFLHRNRLIAGLSHGLVVAEARRHSGTMSTVNFAIDYGRDVFGVPGSIFSELSSGTNAMIREGAYLAGSASDVLAVYGIQLPGEDPVETMAKHGTADGRPVPAEAAPAWQQSINRFTERTQAETVAERKRDELPGQQSLGELLRSQLGKSDGHVSAAAAVEAFRSLQQSMPAATASEQDARNSALDEMVAAVSDTVEIGRRQPAKTQPAATRAAPKPAVKPADRVEPYPWHQVERLDKKEIEDFSSAKEKPAKASGGRPSLGSRLFGTGKNPPGGQPQPKTLLQEALSPPPQPVPRRQAAQPPAKSTAPIGRIEPVDRVAAVAPTAGVSPARAVSPVAVSPNVGVIPQAPAEAPAPRPAAPAPAAKPQSPAPKTSAASLSGRLSTLQQPAARQPAQDAVRPTVAVPPKQPPVQAPAGDPAELLSDTAQRALRQLGPIPISLSVLCDKSGLSSAEAMAALTELELAGLSRQLAGRQFVREG